MSTLLGKLKHEILKALPPTIFFFVILHIVAIIRALMIKGTTARLYPRNALTVTDCNASKR